MVHIFSVLGVNIAVDVGSGAIHRLDDLAFELLRFYGENIESCPDDVSVAGYSRYEVESALSELRVLVQEGLLFSEDAKYAPDGAEAAEMPVKALCLHVSHDCNLRCEYCFAAKGDFGTGRGLMDAETARRAIDFVVRKSGKRRNIEIDFFGGEPLMALDTVKETVRYARGIERAARKNFRFTITTNGILLDDDAIAFINREMSNVVLSLDGREKVNDALRKTIGGRGSYAVIVPKFQKLVKSRTSDYYVRGTFTRGNLDFAEDALHLAGLGFHNISIEPAVGAKDSPHGITEEDLPEIFAEYERLAGITLLRDDFSFFHFLVDPDGGPCVIKRVRGCGAGSEYAAVTPEGDIYPCHQFVGRTDYKMGNVHDGGFDLSIASRFLALNVHTKPDCRDCWAKYYCSGGCAAGSLNAGGDISVPERVSCMMQKKRLECALALYALNADKEGR